LSGKTRTVLNTTMNAGTFTTQQDQDKQKGHSGQAGSSNTTAPSFLCDDQQSLDAV
jgi:hypothetical protein